jgi:hypothetical protein
MDHDHYTMDSQLERRFFHSFPRPKKNESPDATLARGLRILEVMKQVGLVLAPEVVNWDVSLLGANSLSFLQRRASFTELSFSDLADHSAAFGPISLSFGIAALRDAGATPVIYVPQGTANSPVSLIATFCVNGAYHTKGVLSQLQQLKEVSDPELVSQRHKMPVSPEYELTLQNAAPDASIAAQYKVRASVIRDILQYIGFRNIPFDHSTAILGYFLNIFYPTDNAYRSDQLAYYRQREWRLVASDIGIKGRPIIRDLSGAEKARLEDIDPEFWLRELAVDGKNRRRVDLAVVYEPEPGWDFLKLVHEVLAPASAVDRIRTIVGDGVAVRSLD